MTEADSDHFPCALITGASSGLGEEFARQLAPVTGRMILVGRRHERLLALEEELRADFPGLEVGSLLCDLADAGAREELVQRVNDTGWSPSLLVNNAGLGDYGEFSSSEWEKVQALLRVNIEALTHLAHGFLPPMIAAGRGAILNVSSLAGDLPIPDFAVYAASKAYVSSFSEGLRLELRDHGIRVLALCPGPVRGTGFGEVARRAPGENSDNPLRENSYVERAQVVAEALHALAHDRARCYPGLRISLTAVALSLLPLAVIRLIMARRPRRVEEV
jgi:short-subunit dehydrogenase